MKVDTHIDIVFVTATVSATVAALLINFDKIDIESVSNIKQVIITAM